MHAIQMCVCGKVRAAESFSGTGSGVNIFVMKWIPFRISTLSIFLSICISSKVILKIKSKISELLFNQDIYLSIYLE